MINDSHALKRHQIVMIINNGDYKVLQEKYGF